MTQTTKNVLIRGLLLGACGGGVGYACTSQELDQVRDAASVRARICADIDLLAEVSSAEELKLAQFACRKGDSLQDIAAAAAGSRCVVPSPSASTPEPTPAQEAAPAPVSGPPPSSPAGEETSRL